MIKFLFCQLFLLQCFFFAHAQEPLLTWGTAVEGNPVLHQKMQVIGSPDGRNFYTFYVEEGQATLEKYDENNQRVWATALFPKTPTNQPATFAEVVLLQDRLYLLSTFRAKSTTTVYVQEISASGNYGNSVQAVLSIQGNAKLHTAVSESKTALLVTLHEGSTNSLSAKLLSAELQPRWSQALKSEGVLAQLLLQDNGTAYVLAHAPAKNTSPFLLHRLSPQNGQPTQLALTIPEQFKPIQAGMVLTSQGLVVTGYYATLEEAEEQNPEPKGTFFYAFDNGSTTSPVTAYTPFNPVFLKEYKRYKPDADKMQRLRNLQLRQVLPMPTGGVIVIGEEAFINNKNGNRTFHNEDIVVTRLDARGASVYTTSSNKLQSATANDDKVSSFAAITSGETLHILYLDFEYNYTADNRIIMAGQGAIEKMPVLVTIPPAGKPLQVTPMHHSQTGRSASYYLRPTAAFPINDQELIVLSVGNRSYKYGRLKLQ